MNLQTALSKAEQIVADGHVVEQIRMGSPDDLESYQIIVRLNDGKIYQHDDVNPWPPPPPPKPEFVPTPEGVVVKAEEDEDNPDTEGGSDE